MSSIGSGVGFSYFLKHSNQSMFKNGLLVSVRNYVLVLIFG